MLEEAWHELDHYADQADELHGVIMDAARDAMLAVLDEAQRIAWATFMVEDDSTIKPNPAWDALRTRIQEPVRAERS